MLDSSSAAQYARWRSRDLQSGFCSILPVVQRPVPSKPSVASSCTLLTLFHCTAELFTWAARRSVSRKDAMRCASQCGSRGRWEANQGQLDKLGT